MQLVQELANNQPDQQVQAEHHIHDSSSLIKVNADITENRKTMAIWCSFFIIVGFIYILTFALPNTFITKIDRNIINDCPDFLSNEDISKDEFLPFICQRFKSPTNMNYGGIVYSMSRLKQFLIVRLVLSKKTSDAKKDIKFTTKFQGHFYELTSDFEIESRVDTKVDHELTFECPAGTIFCNEVTLLYHSKIDHPNYAFVVTFSKDVNWLLSDNIDYLQEYVNPDYTGFLIALRYTCLFVSAVMCISFIRRLQRINSAHWVIEQKMIVVLSGLLILFNNPFYALTILTPNMASAFFEVLFIVNFFVVLLIFFLVVLDRVIRENGQKESKSLDKKKLIFGIVLYFFLLLTYIGFSYNHLDDPYTSFQDSFGGFYEFCKWVGIVMLIGYFLSILLFYINIFKRYNSLIWRNRLFSLFSLYYIVCTGIFAFSGSIDIYGSIGGRALLFITILNLYIYYMQYMYSFSPQGYQEAQQIINLEIGNRPQIYEVLDDSLHGIEMASQNGDVLHNQKLTNNNQEQILAQDIFQQHQMLNQMKQQDDRDTQSQGSSKKSNLTPNYQQDIESDTPQKQQNQVYQANKKVLQNNNNNHQQFEEAQNDDENGDGDLVLNFEDQKDDDEDD